MSTLRSLVTASAVSMIMAVVLTAGTAVARSEMPLDGTCPFASTEGMGMHGAMMGMDPDDGAMMRPGMHGAMMRPGMHGAMMRPGMHGAMMRPGMHGAMMGMGGHARRDDGHGPGHARRDDGHGRACTAR